jgi:hypothetical protein
MAESAKSEKSVKLKLLDLDDDALIMIIGKLNFKSKLKMMATCKRFEGLIGNEFQFYKNFKLCYDQYRSPRKDQAQYLEIIRRKFGTVEVSGGKYYSGDKSVKPPTQELLKKIGAHILKIKLGSLTLSKSDWSLMKLLPKIRELKIDEIQFSTDPAEEIGKFEFDDLTKLEVHASINIGFFATFIPSSLKILKFYVARSEECWDADVLGKQKKLEELSLQYCKIKEFKFDPENCHIKKLEFYHLEFPTESTFEKFSNFMKIQESVTELVFEIDENGSNRNYAGLLEHLLGLKTLKKVTVDCKYRDETLAALSKLKVRNPTVKNLIIQKPPLRADLKPISKFFPNVTDFKIFWKCHEDDWIRELLDDDRFYMNLQPINSMKMVRKLEIEYVTEEMLAQLELKEMRQLHIKEVISTDDDDGSEEDDELEDPLANWRTFTENNCQLEVLHVPNSRLSLEKLQNTLENLPLLRSLEFTVYGCDFGDNLSYRNRKKYKKEQAIKAAKLIGEVYVRFEHLKLDFDGFNLINSHIYKHLKKYYPGVNWKNERQLRKNK